MNNPAGPENPLDRTIVLRGNILSAADDDSAHYLVVVEGAEPGRRVEIGEVPISIGRSEPAEWVLADTEISRRHCSIGLIHGEVVVSDNKSTNGTFVQGRQIQGPVMLQPGALLQLGRHLLRYERRSRREVAAAEALNAEVANARRYIEAILPAPIGEGPITADWVYLPSTQLGGDAFGYRRLDDGGMELYLIDVSGHGAGSAMHAVTVMNVLARHALPQTDFTKPAEVLERLNAMFQADEGGGMFFTAWYGWFDPVGRELHYASAGHHPAYLFGAADSEPLALRTPGLPIGVSPDVRYRSASAPVAPESTLYLFSDGVFETQGIDGAEGRLSGFVRLMADGRGPAPGEPRRLLDAVRRNTRPGGFDDDFTLLTVGLA